jgi:hypothetical protein
VCDQFQAHITEGTKMVVNASNRQGDLIRRGLTSKFQTLDILINKPFKKFKYEEWTKWMEASEHDLTGTGQMTQPTVTRVCQCVKNSWESVKHETYIKSFKICSIINATDDDILFEESEHSNGKISDECDSGHKDLLGFYDQ